MGHPASSHAVEWGGSVGVTAGGPTIEAGPSLRYGKRDYGLDAGLTAGLAYGYSLVGAHAYLSHPVKPGLYVGSGLRSELIFDAGERVFRAGPSAAIGWRNRHLQVALRPTLFMVAFGPSLGLFFTWWP